MWQWCQRWRFFSRTPRDRSSELRTIHCNDPHMQLGFCDNRISSTKYNIFTFLPLNLWVQFHRPINIYFLIVALLQFIPSVATVSPFTTLFPIGVAFLLNAVKDGIDDVRRYRQDCEVNERIYKRLRPGTLEVEDVTSANIRVGNIIILHPFEVVPSDVLILLTTKDEGVVCLTTESLDGETGSKQRFAVLNRMFKHTQTAAASSVPPVALPGVPTADVRAAGDSDLFSVQASPRRWLAGSKYAPMPDERPSYDADDVLQQKCLQFVCCSQVVLISEGPNVHLHSYQGVVKVRWPQASSRVYGATLRPPPASSDSTDDIVKRGGVGRESSMCNVYRLHPGAEESPVIMDLSRTDGAALDGGLQCSGPRAATLPRANLQDSSTTDSGVEIVFPSCTEDRRGLLEAAKGEPGSTLQKSLPMKAGLDSCDYFDGPEETISVNIDNVIYSSSQIGNTYFVVALVIFTGRETKMCMTRSVPPTKWATIDQQFNYLALLIFFVQLILLLVCSFVSSARLRAHSKLWYLGGANVPIKSSEFFPILMLRYLMMLSPMVPLSFKVMVELSKAYISCVIRWDEEMHFEGKPPSVNNSALVEELGQVQYVLSDKTGTLTTNIMAFWALATVEDVVFSISTEHITAPDSHRSLVEVSEFIQSRAAHGQMEEFYLMLTMVFCNTIERELSSSFSDSEGIPNCVAGTDIPGDNRSTDGSPSKRWISSSPDEVALVEGADRCGFSLHERSRTHGKVWLWGEANVSLEVEIVYTLPFSSDRGMMSVLVRCPTVAAASAHAESHGTVHTTSPGSNEPPNEYVLLIKGADERVLACCVDEYSRSHRSDINERLVNFSNEGLRTLVCGYRRLTEDEALEVLRHLDEVKADFTPTVSHESGLQRVYNFLERDITYCGITAVRDGLQKDVFQTVTQLRQADIRVWMLTGDKTETAKQTAVACGLLASSDRIITLTPSHENVLTPAEHLHYVFERLSNVMELSVRDKPSDSVGLVTHWARVHQWCRRFFWERSGLENFVHEFTRRATWERIRPLHHPLVTHPLSTIEDHYGPVCAAVWNMVPVVCGTAHRKVISRFHSAPTVSLCSDSCSLTCGYCVMLSGRTLGLLEEEDAVSKGRSAVVRLFHKFLLEARTVVCSRTTPSHKSYVVKLVRRAGYITLAIGDGGNDVPMLQAAHVGVGMKGREGSQAKLASDFAIGQFCLLSKLLLVHGHVACNRTAMIVQQSFWKTVLIAWVQVLFNMTTDFSAVSFWDSLSLTIYNAIPTVPVTFLCAMNVPLSRWILCSTSQLYRMSQRGRYLSAVTFYGYVARAFLHGTIIYYLSLAIQRGTGGIVANGWTLDRSGDFYAPYIAIVTVHTYMVLTESHAITFTHWFSYFFSIWSCFLCFGVYARSQASSNKTFSVLLTSPSFYLSYLGMVMTVCLSLTVYAIPKLYWFPDDLQLMRLFLAHVRQAGFRSLSRPHRVLGTFFQDDNPSRFWKSLSLYHALHYTVPPRQVFTIEEGSAAEF